MQNRTDRPCLCAFPVRRLQTETPPGVGPTGMRLVWALLDHLNDGVSAGVHQNRPIIDDGVLVLRDTVVLRDVVIGNPTLREPRPDDYLFLVGIRRALLRSYVFAEFWPLRIVDAASNCADACTHGGPDRASNDTAS